MSNRVWAIFVSVVTFGVFLSMCWMIYSYAIGTATLWNMIAVILTTFAMVCNTISAWMLNRM